MIHYLKNQKNKRICSFILLLFCLVLLSPFHVFAQKEKLRVAVIDISSAPEVTSILTTELVNTNKFRVMERARINEILKEQGFQSTQIANSQAVQVGRLLGVHKIITGENSGETISIRFVDVETGDIEASVTISCRRQKSDSKYKGYSGSSYVYWLTAEEEAKKLLRELFKALE